MNKFGMNNIEARSIINEVNSLIEKTNTDKIELKDRIINIEEITGSGKCIIKDECKEIRRGCSSS